MRVENHWVKRDEEEEGQVDLERGGWVTSDEAGSRAGRTCRRSLRGSHGHWYWHQMRRDISRGFRGGGRAET